MTTYKVGTQNFVPISNAKDKKAEKVLVKSDNAQGVSDGLLDRNEAKAAYASATGGRELGKLDDIYELTGGKQRDFKVIERQSPFSPFAPDWKGDFHVDGLGAGNVRTSRMLEYMPAEDKQADVYNVVVDCNLMDKKVLEENIETATLVIARKGFGKESGSKISEEVPVPMNIGTRDGYNTFDRGGGSRWVPEEKLLTCSMAVDSLKKLAARSGGLSFYVRLDMKDGSTSYVNKDGMPGSNFEIAANELKKNDTP